jgi:hypothetical protein
MFYHWSMVVVANGAASFEWFLELTEGSTEEVKNNMKEKMKEITMVSNILNFSHRLELKEL